MSKVTEIYLVRHGETVNNTGESKEVNPPLTAKGIKQAEKTGEYLRQYNKNPKIDCIITSELIRSIETADIIAKEIGYNGDIKRDKRINEGNWFLDEEAQKKIEAPFREYYEEHEKKYKNDPIGYYKHLSQYEKDANKLWKSVGGETTKTMTNNRTKFLEDLSHTKCKKIIIVAHGGTINILCNIILGWSFIRMSPEGKGEKPHGNCSITYIILEDGDYTIVGPMSTSHLES